MKKIILYVRVSTKEQKEKGFSLQTQEKTLREYFKDYDIVKVIYDATSGMKRDRKGLEELRKLLPGADFVGATEYDRLARHPKVMGVIEYWCDENNAKIKVMENPKDDELMSDIKSAVAKNDSDKRIKKILSVKDECFEMGRHIAKPPYGYYYDKNTKPSTLKQNDKISVVKNIFERKLKGDGYLKIAQDLNIVTKKGNVSHIQVRNILTNLFYCGYVSYRGKIQRGIHEAIVSEEDFIKINEIKNENKKV